MFKTDRSVDKKHDTLEFEGQEALDVMNLYDKMDIEDFDTWVDERVVHDHVVVEDLFFTVEHERPYVEIEYAYIPRV